MCLTRKEELTPRIFKILKKLFKNPSIKPPITLFGQKFKEFPENFIVFFWGIFLFEKGKYHLSSICIQ